MAASKEIHKPHVKQKRGAKVLRKKSNELKRIKKQKIHNDNSRNKSSSKKNTDSLTFDAKERKIQNIKTMYARLPSLHDIESDNPPKILVIFGPPKSGKTTFIRTIIHQYSKQKMTTTPVGPITLVTSKSSRLTIIECHRDIDSMLDCAKIADCVVFMFDINTGLETEHLEMTKILNCHGNPRIVAAISHLDTLTSSRNQHNKIVMDLKSRIKSQLGETTSILIMKNGVLNEGKEYHLKTIGVFCQKMASLRCVTRTWRDSNSFIVVDRLDFQDSLSNNHDDDDDRIDVSLFGYIRGSLLKCDQSIIIPGMGDGGPYKISNVTCLNDPCPLKSKLLKKRSLLASECVVYCPRGLNSQNQQFVKSTKNIKFEKVQQDRFIENFHENIEIFPKTDSLANVMSRTIINKKSGLESNEAKIANLKLLNIKKEYNNNLIDEISNENQAYQTLRTSSNPSSHIIKDDKIFMDHILENPKSYDINKDHQYLKYMKDDIILENFIKSYNKINNDLNDDIVLKNFKNKLNSHFLTQEINRISQKSTNDLLNNNSDDSYDENDDDINENESNSNQNESIDNIQIEEETKNDLFCGENSKNENDKNLDQEELSKSNVDSNNISKKSEHILKLIDKSNYQQKVDSKFFEDNKESNFGYSTGLYVKILIKGLPKAFAENFDDSSIIIVGSINPNQENDSFLKCLLDMHCLQNKPLKSNIPSMISYSWFRIQSAGIFCTQSPNLKMRFLKYLPKLVSSYFVFHGPVQQQKTGIVLYSNKDYKFRILATGSLVGCDSSIKVQKKLKLIGKPLEIYQKTAIIGGLFNSDIESVKFEGAKLQTVSGIRGMIKRRAKSNHIGAVRATFEDKISLNDLVFLKTWHNINIVNEKYFIPNLLMSNDNLKNWQGLNQDSNKTEKTNFIHNFTLKHNNNNNNNGDNSMNDGYDYASTEKIDKKPIKIKISDRLRNALPFNLQKRPKTLNNDDEKFKNGQTVEEILDLNQNQPKNHKRLLQLVDEHRKRVRHCRLEKNKKKIAIKSKLLNNTQENRSKSENNDRQQKKKLIKRLKSLISKGI